MKTKLICCPMCNGSGKIKSPEFRNTIMEEKKITAKRLRAEGYSIREIMKAMGYKSTRSVSILLT